MKKSIEFEFLNSLKKCVKVHFNRSKILLLYFYDAYDVSVWEKNFGQSTAYSCRNVFIELHHFMKKKKDTPEDEKTQAKHF